MARNEVRNLCFAAMAAALILQGCGKPSPVSLDRGSSRPVAGRTAEADPLASRSDAPHGWAASRNLTIARAFGEQYQAEDLPPWLAELFHDPDPNVRAQALDAWARQPGASLDPVTYALVDPDESVRVRAQEVFEQDLARR